MILMKNNKNYNQDKKRILTRRSFLGIGAIATLSLFLAPRFAWGGVGGGAWGNYGGRAWIGSHYGYDGGWFYAPGTPGYFAANKVWLAVSSNATVARMSDLLCEIAVSSYYANWGAWGSATWTTDHKDVEVTSYIKNNTGSWLASAYGVYDNNSGTQYFQGPFDSVKLTVRRDKEDWTSWAGVNVQCNGWDHARGINTTAEASQIIPAHGLINDDSLQGKIYTLSPKCSSHLVLDVTAGRISDLSETCFWTRTHTTNQLWIVEPSHSSSLMRLIPVHVNANKCLEICDGEAGENRWTNFRAAVLRDYRGAQNQHLWLHRCEDGYVYPVFDSSGFALNCVYAGTSDGTAAAQYNCFAAGVSKVDTASLFEMEEAVFHEREAGLMSILGNAEVGQELWVSNPEEKVLQNDEEKPRCYPYNYPRTNGMIYLYSWYRGDVEGARSIEIQGASENSHYLIQESDAGLFLTCVVHAQTRFGEYRLKGEVVCPSVKVQNTTAQVHYFADNETAPAFTEEVTKGHAFYTNPEAIAEATKANCSGFEGWYIDRECTVLFSEGEGLEGDLALYGRNKVTVRFDMTNESKTLFSEKELFSDRALLEPAQAEVLLPQMKEIYYQEQILFERCGSVWFEDQGRIREAIGQRGVYALPEAVGTPVTSMRVLSDVVLYIHWYVPRYEGIEVY